MGGIETAWVMLNGIFGIGRAAEPAAIAAAVLAVLLSILAGSAAGKLVLWLPGGIERLLLHLGGVLGNMPDSQSGRAEEEMRSKPKEEEDAEGQDGEEESEGEEEPEEEPQKGEPLDRNFYLERELARAQREELLGRGYKRLKTSPFGDSGASYYLVNKRWNESAEHAFFCYLIESELSVEIRTLRKNGPEEI